MSSTYKTQLVSVGMVHRRRAAEFESAVWLWLFFFLISTASEPGGGKSDPCCDPGGCVQFLGELAGANITTQCSSNAVCFMQPVRGGTVGEKRSDVGGYFSRWGSPVTQCTCSVRYRLQQRRQ